MPPPPRPLSLSSPFPGLVVAHCITQQQGMEAQGCMSQPHGGAPPTPAQDAERAQRGEMPAPKALAGQFDGLAVDEREGPSSPRSPFSASPARAHGFATVEQEEEQEQQTSPPTSDDGDGGSELATAAAQRRAAAGPAAEPSAAAGSSVAADQAAAEAEAEADATGAAPPAAAAPPVGDREQPAAPQPQPAPERWQLADHDLEEPILQSCIERFCLLPVK